MTGWQNKRCFVTGATGFLGGAIVKRLSAEGAIVRALARRPNRDEYIRQLPNVEIVMGDINNIDDMGAVVQGCDVVIHSAAALGGSYQHQYHANVEGTRSTAFAAAQAGIERFVHISSIAVYGFEHEADITEHTARNPFRDPYNRTKAQAELELVQIAEQHRLKYTIIRPGIIYGPRSNFWTAQWFQRAKMNPTLFIGDGSGHCPAIHVDDVVDFILTAAIHPNAINQAFNCAPDPSPTWRDFLSGYAALAGHQNWLGIPPMLMKPVAHLLEGLFALRGEPKDLPHLLEFTQRKITYRMDKAKELLGWQAQISLEDGIQSCVPYLQEIGLLR